MAASDRFDAIVIGAGVVGLSAARALAGERARVLVVERGRVGGEASSAAAGMLAAQAEAEAPGPLLDLALLAREHHLALAAALEEETGVSVELSRLGLLEAAFTEDEENALEQRLRWQRARGLPVEVLGPEDVRQAEPNVNPSVRKALFFGGDRRVDNVRLTRALAAAAVARGAVLLTGRPVSGLRVEGGRVTGVRAGDESWSAPVVVEAMGAWSGRLGSDPQPPPVEPVRGQIVAFEVAPALLRHVVRSSRGYLVPRADGRIIAGSTSERVGFAKTVTAAGMRAILDGALNIAPVLADERVADAWAGLRPGTPDGLPVIGEGALPGLIHATGLYRNGILLGPLVGQLAADLVLGRPPAVDLAAFSPERFARPARSV